MATRLIFFLKIIGVHTQTHQTVEADGISSSCDY